MMMLFVELPLCVTSYLSVAGLQLRACFQGCLCCVPRDLRRRLHSVRRSTQADCSNSNMQVKAHFVGSCPPSLGSRPIVDQTRAGMEHPQRRLLLVVVALSFGVLHLCGRLLHFCTCDVLLNLTTARGEGELSQMSRCR